MPATLRDLRIGGQGDAVTSGQLHPLGIVAFHEPLSQAVAQDSALTAGRLGDQGARGILGFDDARRMELDELGVAQTRSGLDGQAERIAGVLIPTGGGPPPDAVVPAGGEDDGVGVDAVGGAVDDVEAEGTEDATIGDEELRDVDPIEDRDVQGLGTTNEGALDLQARVISGESGAAPGVGAEEALRDPTVVLLREVHSISLQVGDAFGCALGDDLDGAGVGEVIGFLDRIGRVLLPRVLGVDGGQCGVDAAGGERGVCVFLRALAHGEDIAPCFGDFDRGAQARSTGADDEHGGGDGAFSATGCSLCSGHASTLRAPTTYVQCIV